MMFIVAVGLHESGVLAKKQWYIVTSPLNMAISRCTPGSNTQLKYDVGCINLYIIITYHSVSFPWWLVINLHCCCLNRVESGETTEKLTGARPPGCQSEPECC